MTPGGRGASHSQEGVVLESLGGRYRVRFDDGSEGEAVLRGRLRLEKRTGDRVVTGDRVRAAPVPDSDAHTLEEILPRQNELVRAGPGGRGARVVAANLDRCFVVLAVEEPAWDSAVADRFLALAESAGIPPILVVNKGDLPQAAELIATIEPLYRAVGYEVLVTSAKAGLGVARLRDLLSSGISAIIGPSGVGKSSLLNALEPGLSLRTQEVRLRSGQGRHTTVSARLLPLSSGGWVADTPGFSDVRLWGVGERELSRAFPEFDAPSEACRFRGCSHIHEPDCAVREAVAEGRIAGSRYESYRMMADSLND
ncbi:MAG: ribosome small subunit-dependent GTPase A [Gemmatimonadota bacterium]